MTTEDVPERQQRFLDAGVDRQKLQRAMAAFGAEAISRRVSMSAPTVRTVATEWGLSFERDGNPDNLVLEEFLPASIGRPRGDATPGNSRAKKPAGNRRPEPLLPGIPGAIQGLERELVSIQQRIDDMAREYEELEARKREVGEGLEALRRIRQ